MEQPAAAKHAYPILLFLLALCGVIFFFGLGRVALLGPDEPRYAEVAREMFVSGDYISPRLCGCLWLEKPALLYWLAAASYQLLGVNEYAARLPSALAATLTVLSLWWALSRAGFARLAVVAALLLATSALFIGYARAATPDMLLTAAVTIALLSGYLWTTASGRARKVCWMVLWVAAGFAVLAKGLIGIIVIVPVLGIYLAITGELKLIDWRGCVTGLAVFLGVVSIWYVPVTVRHGWAFVDEFFVKQHFQRYLTNIYHHPQPAYFFPIVALAGVLPWAFFMVPAVARLRALRPRVKAEDSILALAWVWVAWPLVFFSLSVSKLPGYILPIFPALAIIAGVEVERFRRGERQVRLAAAAWITAFSLVAISAGFVVYTERQLSGVTGWRMVLSGLPAAAAAATALFLAAKRPRALVIGTAAVMATLVVSAVVLLSGALTERATLKSFSLESAAQLRPDERIAFFIKSEYAPVFYAEGRVVCGVGEFDVLNALSEETLVVALENERTLVVITGEDWRDELEGYPLLTAELIGEQGKTFAYRVALRK
ncbi:MAG: glycosyltransferase family 39 protein [Acidobacteriota bacterium]